MKKHRNKNNNVFQRSRGKIVAVAMLMLLLVFAGTITLIYVFSYQSVMKTDREMMSLYAQAYWENGMPDGETQPPEGEIVAPENGGDETQGGAAVSSFHSVAFDENGDVLALDYDTDEAISDSGLVKLAEELKNSSNTFGASGRWVYYIETNEGTTLVVLMDNTIMTGAYGRLLRYTLVFGAAAAVILFFFARWTADRIVRPLEEQDELQKQFVSDAGHELKTPLASISTNAELLESETGQNRWLSNIRYETDRMSTLVNELLNLSRAEKEDLPMEKLDFSRIVTGGVLPFEAVAYEKGVQIAQEISDGVSVNGNATQLGELISVLTDNAVSYAPENSTVKVCLRRSGKKAVLEMTNDGGPIPEDVQKHLFDRFYRADTAHTDDHHFGMGLSIATAVVSRHHGRIGVTCENGTVTFRVQLPAVSS